MFSCTHQNIKIQIPLVSDIVWIQFPEDSNPEHQGYRHIRLLNYSEDFETVHKFAEIFFFLLQRKIS